MQDGRFTDYLSHAQQFGARTVLLQDAAARRLGLTPTELETFRLLQHEGPVTASELAQQSGLTRASMSAIVDKLANRDFLFRTQDRNDRRRWTLEANPAAIAIIDALYSVHAKRVEKALAEYSEGEFAVVLRFLSMFAEELKTTAIELGQTDEEPSASEAAE